MSHRIEADFAECHDGVIEAAADLAKATAEEMLFEAERAGFKQRAILRLMGTNNPLTSTSDKPKLHSASSAESVVETDPQYEDYLRAQRGKVVNTIIARAGYECAKARLWLAARLAADTQTEALR